jgi:hypothetical protein
MLSVMQGILLVHYNDSHKYSKIDHLVWQYGEEGVKK